MEAVKNKTEEELDEDVKLESEEVPVNMRHLIREYYTGGHPNNIYEGIHLNKKCLEYFIFFE